MAEQRPHIGERDQIHDGRNRQRPGQGARPVRAGQGGSWLALIVSQIRRLFPLSLSVPIRRRVLAGFQPRWPGLKMTVAGFDFWPSSSERVPRSQFKQLNLFV
jgi:hypothetical protein